VTAVLDTGFTDYLALSFETVAFLNLPMVTEVEVLLGDGSRVVMPVFHAEVLWDGRRRSIYRTGKGSDRLVNRRDIQHVYDLGLPASQLIPKRVQVECPKTWNSSYIVAIVNAIRMG
jgi:hypothetical protein